MLGRQQRGDGEGTKIWGARMKDEREKILISQVEKGRENPPASHEQLKFEGCASVLLKYCPLSNKTGRLSVKELRRMLLKCSLSLSINFSACIVI